MARRCERIATMVARELEAIQEEYRYAGTVSKGRVTIECSALTAHPLRKRAVGPMIDE